MTFKFRALSLLFTGLLLPSLSSAVPITLGGALPDFRTATLSDATSGTTGSSNATVTDVDFKFAGDKPWTERGSIAGNKGSFGLFSDGMFSINVTGGTFGAKEASGTWSILDPDFWTTYAVGAISMHVGNGGGEPDHFIWKLTPDLLTGTWSYSGKGLGGGGLSNLKLYSAGIGSRDVPDGGTNLLLLSLSLVGLTAARKLRAA